MKVLFLVARYHSNMVPMVEALLSAGHDPHVICQYRYRTDNYEALEPKIVEKGVANRRFALKFLSELRPDLLIVREFGGKYLSFLHAAKILGIRCVTYDLAPYHRQFGIRRAFRRLCGVVSRGALGYPLRRLTPVIGQADGVPDWFSSWFPFPMEADVASINRSYRGEKPVVLCVGKLAVPRKRHDWVISAVTKIDIPCHVLIVGAGNDCSQFSSKRDVSYYQKIVQTRDVLGDDITAEVVSDVSHSKMRLIYQKADILAFPARQEPFGICALEAMACGCAVLVSDGAGSSGCIRSGYNGFTFLESSFDDFSTKLKRLISDPQLVECLGSRAYETVHCEHKYQNFVDKLERICER